MVAQKKKLNMKVEKLTKDNVKSELAGFESKYNMTSTEFIRKYNRCEFEEENLEFMDWAGYYYIAGRMGLLEGYVRV